MTWTFLKNGDHCINFEEALALLRMWYHRDEQRASVLFEWQRFRLTEEMTQNHESSKQAVLRTFAAMPRTLQWQLNKKYHGDGYFVDLLLTEICITYVQATLEQRMSRTFQQAIHRISNRNRDKPRTVGAMIFEKYTERSDGYQQEEELYSLGRRYGGEVNKFVKL